MYCHKCGKELSEDMEFCANCGVKLKSETVQVQYPLQKESIVENNEPPQIQQIDAQKTVEKAERMMAEKKINEMLELCSTEQEFLMLRHKILQMEVDNQEKAMLLEILDVATRVRLDPILELAEDYEEIKDSPVGNIVGCAVVAGIGFCINYFFSMKWPGIICCVIAALSITGTMIDRLDVKKVARQREAAELVETYRRQGYKI